MKNRSLARVMLAKESFNPSGNSLDGVRSWSWFSVLRTTSSLVDSATGERMTAEHAHSRPTRATASPNAVAIEALMRLSGEHGSSITNTVKVLVPVSTKTVAVGRMLTLLIWMRDERVTPGAAGVAALGCRAVELCRGVLSPLVRVGRRGPSAASRCRSVWCSPWHSRHVSVDRQDLPECWWARQFGQYRLASTARSRFSALNCRKRLHLRSACTPLQIRHRNTLATSGWELLMLLRGRGVIL